jgi:outer membrane protein assembly factor BamD (BamD/ComL family)
MNKAMKDHGLPYGLAYFNLRTENEEKAEKAWKRFCKRYGTAKTKGK